MSVRRSLSSRAPKPRRKGNCTMTTLELVRKLLEYPPDTEVLVREYDEPSERELLRSINLWQATIKQRDGRLYIGEREVGFGKPGMVVVIL